jgi:hypothetical protein
LKLIGLWPDGMPLLDINDVTRSGHPARASAGAAYCLSNKFTANQCSRTLLSARAAIALLVSSSRRFASGCCRLARGPEPLCTSSTLARRLEGGIGNIAKLIKAGWLHMDVKQSNQMITQAGMDKVWPAPGHATCLAIHISRSLHLPGSTELPIHFGFNKWLGMAALCRRR